MRVYCAPQSRRLFAALRTGRQWWSVHCPVGGLEWTRARKIIGVTSRATLARFGDVAMTRRLMQRAGACP